MTGWNPYQGECEQAPRLTVPGCEGWCYGVAVRYPDGHLSVKAYSPPPTSVTVEGETWEEVHLAAARAIAEREKA